MVDKSGKVEFGISPDTVPIEGVCVVIGLDKDGDKNIEVSVVGDPPTWTVMGMLQTALDQIRGQVRDRWSEEE